MKPALRIASLALAVLMLCSCGDEQAQDAGLKAGGQILERSITDEMIPYDTLRSQPPLAAPELKRGEGATASTAGAGEASADTEAQASDAAGEAEAATDDTAPPDE